MLTYRMYLSTLKSLHARSLSIIFETPGYLFQPNSSAWREVRQMSMLYRYLETAIAPTLAGAPAHLALDLDSCGYDTAASPLSF